MGWSQIDGIVPDILAFEAINLAVCVNGDVEVRVRALSLRGAARRSAPSRLRQFEVRHDGGVSLNT